MRRLLPFSLVLNLVLLLAAGWRTLHPPPMSRVPRSEVGESAGKRSARRLAQVRPAASPPATPWAAIESADLQRFIANLRTLRCPEQTIRDIVALRIFRAYRDRYVESEGAAMRASSPTRPRDRHEWRASQRQRQALRNEMTYTLESVLGQNWPVLAPTLLGWGPRWRDPMELLDVEKRRQVREWDLRYDELKDELEQKGRSGQPGTDYAARLRELERQQQADLAAILSPQELREYLYRQSPAANYVRNSMPAAKSESEFRAMVDVVSESQVTESSDLLAQRLGVEPGDPAVRKAQTDRQAIFDQRLKEVLGEARIAEQQAEEEQRRAEEKKREEAENERREAARLSEMAASVGIAEAEARRFFDRLKELEPVLKPKFEAMEKSLTGTDEEKRRQMDTFAKAELRPIAVEIMGEKGPAFIEKLAESGK